ncbi:MAG: DUF2892 domain-containing protein [Ectobacillus sp.]
MKPNIGTLNALIRITIGLAMINFSTAKLSRKPWCFTSKLSIILGAMKVAEGIVRFCPVVETMKFNKYMNLPIMNFIRKGQSNTQEAHRSPVQNQANSSHDNSGKYDASDKELETEIAAVLGTNSL